MKREEKKSREKRPRESVRRIAPYESLAIAMAYCFTSVTHSQPGSSSALELCYTGRGDGGARHAVRRVAEEHYVLAERERERKEKSGA